MSSASRLTIDGGEIAYHYQQRQNLCLVFLPGFKSNMYGTKAEFLDQLCSDLNISYLRFDYRGHGLSSGELEDCGIEEWLADVLAVIGLCVNQPLLLVGSSMGGGIALLAAKHLQQKVMGVVGIAAAPDSVERLWVPNLTESMREALAQNGVAYRPSRYGDGAYPITQKMIDAGKRHPVLTSDWKLNCPLRLLHGLDDPDIPWQHGQTTLAELDCEDAELLLIKGGDHRLSREQDLKVLERTLRALVCDYHG